MGTDGKVLKSTDYGLNWQEVNISGAQDYHLNGVFFANANVGCIVGEKKANPDRFKGVIYRTTNGGTTWYALPAGYYISEKYIPFKDIAFDIGYGGDPDDGYIVAGEGWIYKTTDGGEHWTRELVDPSKRHCFHGVAIKSYDGTVYAVSDAGNSTGIIATKTQSGWQIEYPFSQLELNFLNAAVSYGAPHVAASKGYVIYKNWREQWASHHSLPDQQVLYAIAPFDYWSCAIVLGGSDETIRKALARSPGCFGVAHNWYSQGIKGISPSVAYGLESFLDGDTYLVGTNGRIFRCEHDTDEWPAFMEVYGEYQRVRCEIIDGEEPTYAYIYRSTCPDGPYEYIAQFDFPPSYQEPYIWYDTSVDYNMNYYYKINYLEASNNPACPTGLPYPPNPPPAPTGFTAEDLPYDEGGVVYLTWYYTSPSYVLHRDDEFLYATTQPEYIDYSAVTGKNHSYKIRKRTRHLDWIYSDPVERFCTPINNNTPSVPTNLTGEQYAGGVIKIRWDEPSNVDIAGYSIYRKINSGSYSKMNSVVDPRAFWYDQPFGWYRAWYKVTAVDWSGNESDYSNIKFFRREDDPTSVQGQDDLFIKTILRNIVPNPITSNAVIYFELAKDDYVQIELYDALGRSVDELFSGSLAPGSHQLQFNCEKTNRLPNGVYFLKMNTTDYQALKKIVIRR